MRSSLILACLASTLALTGCGDDDEDARASWLQATLVEDNRILMERSPALLAGKLVKMAARPYNWFRGNMAVYLADAHRPGPGFMPTRYATGPAARVLLMGDPHPENIGSYHIGDGHLVLEYNDFDGAHFGPFHQDVRRLGLGFAVAMAEAGQPPEVVERVVHAAVRGYVSEIEGMAGGRSPLVITSLGEHGPIVADLFRRARRDGDDREALDEYTVVDGETRAMFHGEVEPPEHGVIRDRVEPVSGAEFELVADLIARYPTSLVGPRGASFFEIKDISRRLGAGVSSYALRRYYVLVEGDTSAVDDDRLLEVKEVLDPTTPGRSPHLLDRAFTGNGARVVGTQRVLQSQDDCDPLLGWATAAPLEVRVRERTKYQKGIDVGRIADRLAESRWSVDDVVALARLAGRLLGRSHGRAPTLDGDAGLNAIAAALGDDGRGFVDETTRFVTHYLPQVMADHQILVRLLAEEGPWLGYRPASR